MAYMQLARRIPWLVSRCGLQETTVRTKFKRIEKLVDADSRVLVVGAHIGTLVVPLAKIVKHVTAIEANPDTFQLLELNLALNDLENCRAINIAA